MYTAPDFVKVKTNVKDVFAAYGCPMDQFGQWTYTEPCDGAPDYQYVGNNFVGLGWGLGCYTKQYP